MEGYQCCADSFVGRGKARVSVFVLHSFSYRGEAARAQWRRCGGHTHCVIQGRGKEEYDSIEVIGLVETNNLNGDRRSTGRQQARSTCRGPCMSCNQALSTGAVISEQLMLFRCLRLGSRAVNRARSFFRGRVHSEQLQRRLTGIYEVMPRASGNDN